MTSSVGTGTILAPATARLFDAMPDAVIVCDSAGVIVFANTNVESLLGYSPGELQGEPVETLVPNAALRSHSRLRKAYMERPVVRPMSDGGQLEASHRSGHPVPVSISLSPMEESGRSYVIAAIRDETPEREAVETLAREAAERAALVELSRATGATLDMQTICERLAERMADFIPFDRLVFSRFDTETLTMIDIFVAGEQVGENDQGRAFQWTAERAEALVKMDGPLCFGGDTPERLLKMPVGEQEKLAAGFESVIFTPLVWNGQLMGSMNLRSRKPGAYDERDREFAERVGAQICGAIVNARLHRQTVEEAEERRVLLEISRIITASPDISGVMDGFAKQARRLLPIDRLAISMIDIEVGATVSLYSWGINDPVWNSGIRRPLAGTVAELALRQGRPVVVDEAAARRNISFFAGLGADTGESMRSWLATPLMSGGRAIGVMHMRTALPDAYGAREQALAERIGSQVAGALANASLHRQTVEAGAERQAIAEIGSVISSSLDIDEVFEQFSERLRRLIPTDRITIDTIDPEQGTLSSQFLWGLDVPGREKGTILPLAGSLVGHVVESGDNLLVGDPAEYDRIARDFPLMAPQVAAGLQSQIMVRLVASNRTTGVLNIQSYSGIPYAEADLQLAERLAPHVSAAVENARLHEETEREARERSTLAEIAVIVSSDLNLGNTYERVADQIANLIRYDRLGINLIDPDTGELSVGFARGRNVPGLRVGDVVHGLSESGLPPWEWASRLDAEPAEPGFNEILVKRGLLSRMAVPLGTEAGGPIGYISLRSRRAAAYSQDHLDLLTRVALHITPALQNALAHDQALRLAAEHERAFALEEQARELVRVDRARTNFLSTVSHELKTPLTSLLAFADLLSRNRESNLTARQQQQIDIMQRSARRLDVLIDDLLDVSRMDAGTFQINMEEYDARELFDEIAGSFAPVLHEREQDLRQDIPGGRIWIKADRTRICQVVTNLVSNASKYSPENSLIELDARVTGKDLSIRITDHGIGISEEDQGQLFSPFFRADNEETRAVQGTGLGLVIVKTIVELHGGSVTLESRRGAGTTVTVALPCVMSGPSEEFKEAERAAAELTHPRSRLDF